jgi:hypothetical protein
VGTVIYLLFFQCFNLPLGDLILVQMFMCVLMLLYFLLTRAPRIFFMMMGNESHAFVHSVGTIDLKLTSVKVMQLKNMQHIPSINKNLVSVSLLCMDGFKVVLESNKFVVSKCEQFIGKGYECGGLFHFSVSDFYNKSVNNICDGINESDAGVWHSHLCHLNFGSMSRLSNLNLILNLSIVKGSK